ncbi:hypothetical protein MAM1_0087c04788 [Mucor ambiguus]|uniref:Uncharacterized protein n=1 Tax=Mucor ambiguus TaxID=91626 RepID=A0A0C9MTE1_9FUNG|nr:hypothetical protein MAM1_0087c04788 [Mucor ambiguus]
MYLTSANNHIILVHPSPADGWATNSMTFSADAAFLFFHAGGFGKEMLCPIMKRPKYHFHSLREYELSDTTFIFWNRRNHGNPTQLNNGRLSEQYRISNNAIATKRVIEFFELNTAKYKYQP